MQKLNWRTSVVGATLLTLAATAGCSGSRSLDEETDTGVGEVVSSLPECSEDELAQPDSSTSGTVTAVMEEVTDLEAVEALIPEFNEEYPNIEIEIEGSNYDVIREKQIASFQKSEGTYNLLQVDTAWVPEYAQSDFLVDLGPSVACLGDEYDYEDFNPAFREIGQAFGSVYAVPFYSYPTGFIYRTDLWDSVPTTLDELVTEAEKKTDGDLYGVALQPKQGATIVEEFNAFLLGAGGQMREEDGTWGLDTAEGAEALEAYISLFEKAAPEGSLNWGFDETIRAASSGQASALTTYGWVTPIVNRNAGDDVEFALAPFPGGRGTGGSWQWGVAANGPDKDAAWAWISWITSKTQDVQRTINGGAPVRDSTMEDPTVWEESGLGEEYFQTYKEIAADSVPICRGTGCAAAVEQVGAALNAAVAGTMSVEEALAQAQQDAEEATQ